MLETCWNVGVSRSWCRKINIHGTKDHNHVNKGTVVITQQHYLDAVKLPIVDEIPQQAGIGTKDLEGEFSRSQLPI